MAKKVYAVQRGRQVGIFDTWVECQAQVNGFSGANFKSFKMREDAKAWIAQELELEPPPTKKRRHMQSVTLDPPDVKLHYGRRKNAMRYFAPDDEACSSDDATSSDFVTYSWDESDSSEDGV